MRCSEPARPEDAEEAGGTSAPAPAPAPAPPEAEARPAWEGDEEPEPGGRRSRTASLVSGLLTELYSCTEEEEVATCADRASRGRPRRSDSLDSSTEASGSDSRVLQELQERPSPRLQMQYLQQKDSSELKTILRELKYRTGIQSAKLLRHLKQRDRLLHKVQKSCDIVTAYLKAVFPKRRKCWAQSFPHFCLGC